jgi:hypothetical protein
MKATITHRAAFPLLLALLSVAGARGAAAQAGRIAIPADTVVRAKLDDRVSSRDARIGDRVMATISAEDRSGFPEGTRFEGEITEVQRSSSDRPGVLNMRWRRAVLPDGRALDVSGRLASLSEDDVRRGAGGRLMARKKSGGSKFDLKWVGYGAAAGAVLGELFGDNLLKGALLGGLGGAIYGYLNRDKGDRSYHEVALDRGTEFGIAMDNRVAFDDRNTYRYQVRYDRPGANYYDQNYQRVLGSRDEYRYGSIGVYVDGRQVQFSADQRPMNINGTLYVPLRAIAQAGNLRYNHQYGEDSFTLATRRGVMTGSAGEAGIGLDDRRDVMLQNEPISVDGEIYVPTEYFNRAADMRVSWNRRSRRLDLDTYR